MFFVYALFELCMFHWISLSKHCTFFMRVYIYILFFFNFLVTDKI